MKHLFVYGSLMFEDEDPSHGVEANEYIKDSKKGWVEGRLYSVEGFPFLVLDEEGKVKGKVFECKNIDHLLEKYDRIQGANDPEPFFEREETDIHLENGSTVQAYVYVGGKRLKNSFATSANRIESGDWREWRDKR